jgi:integrase/recombinase XerD
MNSSAHCWSPCKKVNGQTTNGERTKLHALLMLQRWSGLAIRDAVCLERKKLELDSDGWYKLFLRRANTGVDVYASLQPEIGAELLALPGSRYFFVDSVPKGEKEKDLLIKWWGGLMSKLDNLANLQDENGEPLHFHSHMLRDTFAVWCFNHNLSTEDVAALLGHKNIQITQAHYSPWVKSRAEKLALRVKAAHN